MPVPRSYLLSTVGLLAGILVVIGAIVDRWPSLMTTHQNNLDPNDLDYGIADVVVLLNQGGFRTVTSCHGGRGHAFHQETIGLELEGSYSTFQKRLVRFLRAHGMEHFTITLVTDYPSGNRYMYLSGLDILSEKKRSR